MSKLALIRSGLVVDRRGDPFVAGLIGKLVTNPTVRSLASKAIPFVKDIARKAIASIGGSGGRLPAGSGSVAGGGVVPIVAKTGGGATIQATIQRLLGGVGGAVVGGAAAGAGGAAITKLLTGGGGGGMIDGRRRRRMNFGNARAAGRAIRRIKGTRKLLKRIESSLPRRPCRTTAAKRRAR